MKEQLLLSISLMRLAIIESGILILQVCFAVGPLLSILLMLLSKMVAGNSFHLNHALYCILKTAKIVVKSKNYNDYSRCTITTTVTTLKFITGNYTRVHN